MSQRTRDRIVFGALALALIGVVGWGYATGTGRSLRHAATPGQADARQQAALDRLFSPGRAFDPSADNVTETARGTRDTLRWNMLAQAKVDPRAPAEAPVVDFGAGLSALDGRPVTITGYIFPLEAAGRQRHFLLSAWPPSCPYCLPGGPNELIEVTSDDALPFTYDAVTLRGDFHLLRGEALREGIFFRMTEARAGQ